jgi:hypothetical protein
MWFCIRLYCILSYFRFPARTWVFLCSPQRPYGFWGPPSFLFNAYRGLYPPRLNDRGEKLTTRLHLVRRLRMCGVIPPRVFMALCLITNRGKLHFILRFFFVCCSSGLFFHGFAAVEFVPHSGATLHTVLTSSAFMFTILFTIFFSIYGLLFFLPYFPICAQLCFNIILHSLPVFSSGMCSLCAIYYLP